MIYQIYKPQDMRDINLFKYGNKLFKCWDILVKDYYLFIKNPDDTYKNVLLEFNTEVPKLTQRQRENFIGVLLLSEKTKTKEDSDKKKTPVDIKNTLKKIEIFEKEFHVWVWIVAKAWWFTRNDIMNMPYVVFRRYQEDVWIISWQKAYDPKRHDVNLDKKALNEALNNKKVLKAN